jgi:hypothetical protein
MISGGASNLMTRRAMFQASYRRRSPKSSASRLLAFKNATYRLSSLKPCVAAPQPLRNRLTIVRKIIGCTGLCNR